VFHIVVDCIGAQPAQRGAARCCVSVLINLKEIGARGKIGVEPKLRVGVPYISFGAQHPHIVACLAASYFSPGLPLIESIQL
jgi:hypothetical protein